MNAAPHYATPFEANAADGSIDYARGVPYAACPYPDTASAERWRGQWIGAAESYAQAMRGQQTLIRRAPHIIAALKAAARYLRDLRGSKLIAAHRIRHAEMEGALQNELNYLGGDK